MQHLVRSWAGVVALLAVALPAHVFAGQSGENQHDWIRVTTGADVTGEGFAIGAQQIQGRVVLQDKRTTTFDVSGRQVRVAKPDTTLQGVVEALDNTTLVLKERAGDPPILVPRRAIAGLDVRQRRSLKFYGIVIGAVAGGALGYAFNRPEPECTFLCDLDEFVGVVATFAGGGIGGLVGWLVAPGDKWDRDVPLDDVRGSLEPIRRPPTAVSLSLRF
jgi:hypothetical protein